MKLRVLSDLHTEFYRNPLQFVMGINIVPNLDFLVLAGDIIVPSRQPVDQVSDVLQYLSTKANHVIYVEGNHEFYGGDRPHVVDTLKYFLPSNFTWLQNSEATIEGVHFYGGAMWFENKDGLNQLFEKVVNDWSQIKDLGHWVYQENQQFKTEAMKLVTPETIVVSHSLPHRDSVPAMYKNATTNRFFVSDQTEVILKKEPRLWIHGHTHMPCGYMMGKTRVLCHPYAYPGERQWMGPYTPLVVEI